VGHEAAVRLAELNSRRKLCIECNAISVTDVIKVESLPSRSAYLSVVKTMTAPVVKMDSTFKVTLACKASNQLA
jgi:transcriptional regulator of aromatic amino acid metabolism